LKAISKACGGELGESRGAKGEAPVRKASVYALILSPRCARQDLALTARCARLLLVFNGALRAPLACF
jgi:hypothetical protein